MTHAYAARRAGAPLEAFEFSPVPLGPQDVEVAVSHCGICHSDLHLIDNDWGVSSYPLVPGHEIVGSVTEIGNQVVGLRRGDRVGVGWLAGACMSCAQCLGGNENLCRRAQPTCVGRHGGYATRLRADARFAARIPDALPSDRAAPLLCAGVTVFAPLRRQGLKAGARVGIVGLGGLGHLAVQFAKALGCAVTVFSTSAPKEADALAFGADRFVVVSQSGALAVQANSCDFILITIPVDPPWLDYLNALTPNGTLCIVGAAPGELRVPAIALIDGQKSVCGSAVGSNRELGEMLRLAAEYNIAPQIESFSMADANRALDRLRQNRVRYRAVLVNG